MAPAAVERARYKLAGVLCLATLLRVAAAVFGRAGVPAGDSEWYFAVARNISEGLGVQYGGIPTAYRPPGYPAFLAATFVVFGPSPGVALAANVALSVASLVVAYALARRLFGRESIALGTVLALALYPNLAAYAALVLSEPLFVFLVLFGVWLLVRCEPGAFDSAAVGLVLACASLVRGQGLVVAAVCGVHLLRRLRHAPLRLAARNASIAALAFSLPILAWAVRNYRVFHAPVPIATNTGINLFIGNNPYATGGYVPWSDEERYLVQLREGRQGRVGLNGAEADAVARDVALRYVARHPLATVARMPNKLFHLFAIDGEGLNQVLGKTATEAGQPTRSPVAFTLLVVNQLYYMLVLALFACACLRIARLVLWRLPDGAPELPPSLGLWIVAAMTGLSLVFFGQGRFHNPMMPWIAMYAVWYVDGVVGAYRNGRTRKLDNALESDPRTTG